MNRTTTLIFVAIAGVAAGVILYSRSGDEVATANKFRISAIKAVDDRPNIVLIYLDDADCEGIYFDWENGQDNVSLPNIRSLAENGMRLTNFHVTTPVCGPSRACMLSGTYAHRNNFRVNRPDDESSNGFSGGYSTFDPGHELGTWMKRSRYNTAFVGKFLHDGFSPNRSKNEGWIDIKPPGWETFIATLGSKYFDFYWFDGIKNGIEVTGASEYRTDFEAQRITELLEARAVQTGPRKPLMLCWAPLAPHEAGGPRGMVESRHQQWQIDSMQPSVDASRESNVDSLPAALRDMPAVTDSEREEFRQQWVRRLQSMRAVDENIGTIREKLAETGELENTIFILTSDHGFQIGQHRHQGKRLPYDRVTRVPCIVSGPGIPAGSSSHELLANIDLAPTLVELGGGQIPDGLDGKSFASVVTSRNGDHNPVHPDGIVIENWEVEYSRGQAIEAVYSSLRLENERYTEWANGEREYYDLKLDPDQHDNRFGLLTDQRKRELQQQLRKVRVAAISPIVASQINLERPNESPVNLTEALKISLNAGPVNLNGYAEDDSGIEEVRLAIKDLNSGQYWNGKQWLETVTEFPCQLGLPGGQITKWSFELNSGLFAAGIPPESPKVELSISASDGINSTRKQFPSFTLNVDEPETWLDSPGRGETVEFPLEITGRAADNTAIAKVVLVVKKPGTNEYWNGAAWTGEFKKLPAEIVENSAGMCRWRYELAAEIKGPLYISARATDDHGVFDSTVAAVTVEVK